LTSSTAIQKESAWFYHIRLQKKIFERLITPQQNPSSGWAAPLQKSWYPQSHDPSGLSTGTCVNTTFTEDDKKVSILMLELDSEGVIESSHHCPFYNTSEIRLWWDGIPNYAVATFGGSGHWTWHSWDVFDPPSL